MSNNNKKDVNRLGLAQPEKLQLNKTVETGKVRQNFSHGRSKMVTVEVRKKRSFGVRPVGRGESVTEVANTLVTEKSPEMIPSVDTSSLTKTEKETRAKALEDANKDLSENLEGSKDAQADSERGPKSENG